MGYMRHHAIVVTSWDETAIRKAHAWATELAEAEGMAQLVTPISEPAINGGGSFAVLPDGSKEGWEDSYRGDTIREALCALLDGERFDDGSTSLDWVLVQFGDDNHDTRVLRDSDEHRRSEATS